MLQVMQPKRGELLHYDQAVELDGTSCVSFASAGVLRRLTAYSFGRLPELSARPAFALKSGILPRILFEPVDFRGGRFR